MTASANKSNQPGRLLASGVAAGILIAAVIVAYMLWPQRLPPTDASTVELVKFVVSERFGELPDEKKMPYIEVLLKQGAPALLLAAGEAKLTEEQRERGIDNAMGAALNVRYGKRLDEWMKLDERGKQQYVKSLVQQSATRSSAAGGAARSPGAGGGGAGGAGRARLMTPARQKRFIENTPPDRRAGMAEFIAAMRKAREGK